MKITQFILLLLFSFQISAQIPDSLEVELPWEVLKLNDCNKTMGEGPRTENENVFINLVSDVKVEGNFDLCSSRTKTWDIFDLLGGETYSFEQLGAPSIGNPIICQEELILTYDQLPYTLNIDDAVYYQAENNEYSFDYNDVTDVERVIEITDDTNFEFFVYNHTRLKVCKLNVYLTQCEEEVTLNFPESAEIVFNKEPYIEVTPEMLGVEIDYPCSEFTTNIKVLNGNSNILPSKFVGKTIAVYVSTSFDDGNEYLKVIQVTVSGEKPDPLPMFIEDVSFSAGETIELEVWSDELFGLTAWQLQLQFKDVEILGVVAGEVFKDVPYNVIDNSPTLRALWFPSNGEPIDIEPEDTWFTITLKSELDGTTEDIFETAQDPWSSIAIDDVTFIFEFEAEFMFNIAPRIALGTDNGFTLINVEVFPNPSNQSISITGFPNSNLPSKVEIFNLEGKSMLKEQFTRSNSHYTLDISELPTGVFILKAENEKTLTTHRITKI